MCLMFQFFLSPHEEHTLINFYLKKKKEDLLIYFEPVNFWIWLVAWKVQLIPIHVKNKTSNTNSNEGFLQFKKEF